MLERRTEIGLRRALGARRRHGALQFVTEAAIVCGLGGLAGVSVGWVATLGFALSQHWTPDMPPAAPIGRLAIAVAVGILAGIYPAIRAAWVAPSEALRSGAGGAAKRSRTPEASQPGPLTRRAAMPRSALRLGMISLPMLGSLLSGSESRYEASLA